MCRIGVGGAAVGGVQVILRATSGLLLLVALAACGGGPARTPAGTPAVTLELSATNSIFDKTQLEVVADAPFAIEFENRDAIPHNVAIQGGGAGMTGEVFGGPQTKTHVFPSLPAGSYRFVCDLHPEMVGTLLSVAP
jgi:plastocyanin